MAFNSSPLPATPAMVPVVIGGVGGAELPPPPPPPPQATRMSESDKIAVRRTRGWIDISNLRLAVSAVARINSLTLLDNHLNRNSVSSSDEILERGVPTPRHQY